MSQTSRKVDAFLELFDEMDRLYYSEASWETKFDLIFDLAAEIAALGFTVEYYDPDTTYEEDTSACFEAHRQRAVEFARAFNVSTRWTTDETE